MFFPFTLIIPWFHSCTQTPQEETFGYKYLLEVFFLSKSGVKCFRERVSTPKLHRGDVHELFCLCNLDAFNLFLICILVVFAVAHCLLSFSTRFTRRTNLFSPNLLLVQKVNTELGNLQVEGKCSSSPKVTNKQTNKQNPACLHMTCLSSLHVRLRSPWFHNQKSTPVCRRVGTVVFSSAVWKKAPRRTETAQSQKRAKIHKWRWIWRNVAASTQRVWPISDN